MLCTAAFNIYNMIRIPTGLSVLQGVLVLVAWRGTVVERRSLAGELSLSCARPAADG